MLQVSLTYCVCVRAKVLPPLRDVKNRPEVGNTLRNKLVRLMTHTDTDVKDCAAEFLFILCKESGKKLLRLPGSESSSKYLPKPNNQMLNKSMHANWLWYDHGAEKKDETRNSQIISLICELNPEDLNVSHNRVTLTL